jgi:hypothetical protein
MQFCEIVHLGSEYCPLLCHVQWNYLSPLSKLGVLDGIARFCFYARFGISANERIGGLGTWRGFASIITAFGTKLTRGKAEWKGSEAMICSRSSELVPKAVFHWILWSFSAAEIAISINTIRSTLPFMSVCWVRNDNRDGMHSLFHIRNATTKLAFDDLTRI